MDIVKDEWPMDLPENFINCPICKKKLKMPKCLPCLHSFCMNCLNVHIMVSKTTESTFDCPVCGEACSAPQANLKRDEWAKHFKSNQLIDSVLDALDLKKGDRKCDPCLATRKRSLAVMWCTSCREALCPTCTTSHKGMRLTRGHGLVEITKVKAQPVAAVIKDEKCGEHEDQFLQFYCKDHQQQCCPTCAVAVHRKCDNVIEMAKLGKEMRSQQKGEKLLKRLNACLDAQKKLLSNKGSARDVMKTTKKDILSEIRDLKTKMIELLDGMEVAFIKEFDSLHENQEQELEKGIEQGQRLAKALENTISVLEAALVYGSDAQFFVTMEKLQEECRRYEKLLVANHTEVKELNYTFKMDERLKLVANSVKKFGHLSIENDQTAKQSLKESHVRETAIFSARAPYDDLRGVDIFQNGDILINDRTSKSVSLFHSNGEFVSRVNFNSRPYGVAVLGVRTACVTFPEDKTIHIIKSSYRKLEDYKIINTTISCFAVTNFAGEYLTIQHKEDKEEKGRVTIAQSEQQIRHKAVIDITANHENVQGIAYDESTGKIFIATDFDAIECYNTRGRFIFRNSYKGYGDFHGMCVDKESNVYVTTYAEKGVLQLTSEGERVRLISTSPLAPFDVAITPRGNKMVVVGKSDMVQVYTFR